MVVGVAAIGNDHVRTGSASTRVEAAPGQCASGSDILSSANLSLSTRRKRGHWPSLGVIGGEVSIVQLSLGLGESISNFILRTESSTITKKP